MSAWVSVPILNAQPRLTAGAADGDVVAGALRAAVGQAAGLQHDAVVGGADVDVGDGDAGAAVDDDAVGVGLRHVVVDADVGYAEPTAGDEVDGPHRRSLDGEAVERDVGAVLDDDHARALVFRHAGAGGGVDGRAPEVAASVDAARAGEPDVAHVLGEQEDAIGLLGDDAADGGGEGVVIGGGAQHGALGEVQMDVAAQPQAAAVVCAGEQGDGAAAGGRDGVESRLDGCGAVAGRGGEGAGRGGRHGGSAHGRRNETRCRPGVRPGRRAVTSAWAGSCRIRR